MNKKINIRPLDDRDSSRVTALILPIQQQEFKVPIGIEDQPDLVGIESYYRPGGGNLWGAFVDEQLVGTIAVKAIGHGAGALRKMFVRQEYRGKEQGIAQQLLNHLLQHCVKENIPDIYLGTVAQMKAAQRFYERNGFRQIDVAALPAYYPRVEVDVLFYHLNLNQQR